MRLGACTRYHVRRGCWQRPSPQSPLQLAGTRKLQNEQLGTDPDVVERLEREFQKHLHVLHNGVEDEQDEPALRHDRHYTALRLALLARKRATVVRLRDENRIDDTVLRQIQARLDIEEVRLSERELVD